MFSKIFKNKYKIMCSIFIGALYIFPACAAERSSEGKEMLSLPSNDTDSEAGKAIESFILCSSKMDITRRLSQCEKTVEYVTTHPDSPVRVVYFLLGAQYHHYGIYSDNKMNFLEKDYKKALDNYSSYLKLDPDAKEVNFLMALIYEEGGYGIEKNLNAAFENMKMAAEAKVPVALENMARYYELGIGVKKDSEVAKRWSELAKNVRNR